MTPPRNVLFVIAPDKFRDEELLHTRQVIEKAGMETLTVSTRTGPAKGMLGHVEQVDLTFDDVAGRNFDALVAVGGSGSPAALWDNPRLREMIQRHHALGKVVGAICLAGVALARAGILKGTQATVYKTDETLAAYRECGVNYAEQPVVASGNVITANGPAAAREFGQAIRDAVMAVK